jgi:O-antigen ligase
VVGGRGFSSKERSAEERIEAWQVGLQLLQWRPLSGAGFGNFTDHNPLTAHNSFVLGFSELGLIGYFFWIALLVLAYKGLSRPLDALSRLAPSSDEHRIATLMRASLVGFLACAWFLSRTYAPSLFFMLGLCVAGGWVARQAIPDPGVRDELAVIPWRRDAAVFLASTIAAVYGFVLMHRLSGG